MEYYIREVLTSDELALLQEEIKRHEYVDGSITYYGPSGVKNTNQIPSSQTPIVNEVIMGAVDRDSKFLNFVLAEESTAPIVSRS